MRETKTPPMPSDPMQELIDAPAPGSLALGAVPEGGEERNSASVDESGGSPPAAAKSDSQHAAGRGDLDPEHWEVEIRIDGERILTIGHSHLSGLSDIDRYGDVVRLCADHLRAFIGSGEPEPCFACGDSGQERWMGCSGEEVGPCSVCSAQAFPCPVCGGRDDDRQLMCEACGGAGLLGEHHDPAECSASGPSANGASAGNSGLDEPLPPALPYSAASRP